MIPVKTPEEALMNERTNTLPLGPLVAFVQATAPSGLLFVRSFAPAQGDQHV